MSLDARLIHHKPGTMIAFEIPLQNGNFGEINYKSVLNSLVLKSQIIETAPPLALSSSSSSSSSLKEEPVFDTKIWHNHYNNIIEKMERKYTSHMICEDESSHDYGYSLDEEEGMMEGAKTKRKKRSNDDYYDYDDDSEEVAEVYIQLKSKKSKTVHSGFFVSTGELEIMKDQENKKTEKFINNDNIKSLNKKEIVQSGAINFGTEDSKLNSIPKLKINSENKPVNPSSGIVKNTVVSTEISMNIPHVRAVRTVKAKPLWKPNSAVLIAIDNFRDFFTSSGIKIGKNHFLPPQLETSLCDLDKVVRAHHSNAIATTSGYIEKIGEIIGIKRGEVTTGRIRNVILKLQFKEDAQVARLQTEGLCDELMIKIKSNVKPFLHLPHKGESASEGVESEIKIEGILIRETIMNPRDLHPLYSVDLSREMNANENESYTGVGSISVDMSTINRTDAINDTLLVDSVYDSNTMKGISNIIGEVADELSGSISLPISTVFEGSIARDLSQNSSSTSDDIGNNFRNMEPSSCTCQIRWDLAMKGLLVSLEAAVVLWVKAENTYRGSLTALDKKDMKNTDFIVINEKDSLGHFFKRILGSYPDFCLHTDLTSLRKMISIEKSRMKKKVAKEKKILLNSTTLKHEGEVKSHETKEEVQFSLQEKASSSYSLSTIGSTQSLSTTTMDAPLLDTIKINKRSPKKNPSKIPPSTSNVQINDSFKVSTPFEAVTKSVKKRIKKSKKEKAILAVTQRFCKKQKNKKRKGSPCDTKEQVEENGGGKVMNIEESITNKEGISGDKEIREETPSEGARGTGRGGDKIKGGGDANNHAVGRKKKSAGGKKENKDSTGSKVDCVKKKVVAQAADKKGVSPAYPGVTVGSKEQVAETAVTCPSSSFSLASTPEVILNTDQNDRSDTSIVFSVTNSSANYDGQLAITDLNDGYEGNSINPIHTLTPNDNSTLSSDLQISRKGDISPVRSHTFIQPPVFEQSDFLGT